MTDKNIPVDSLSLLKSADPRGNKPPIQTFCRNAEKKGPLLKPVIIDLNINHPNIDLSQTKHLQEVTLEKTSLATSLKEAEIESSLENAPPPTPVPNVEPSNESPPSPSFSEEMPEIESPTEENGSALASPREYVECELCELDPFIQRIQKRRLFSDLIKTRAKHKLPLNCFDHKIVKICKK